MGKNRKSYTWLGGKKRMDKMKYSGSTMRDIPGIDKLLEIVKKEPELIAFSPGIMIARTRKVVDQVRNKLKQGETVEVSVSSLVKQIKDDLLELGSSSLRKVVNGTGVVLHTNLGRAPLGKSAIRVVQEVMDGYSNIEYNIETGERGSRYDHVVNKICTLTGAQDAIVVNNNAAAVLLVLSALAKEGEVIVSRGQLVEIGGSFRVPDVLKQSGAILIEVGTTNKTHIADYEEAINSQTRIILKVHTSNYRIVGFTAQPSDKELVGLAHIHELPVVYDLGSGTLTGLSTDDWSEPTISECLATGIDIVTFSGDKLLGAGQAGIIAGKHTYIQKLKKHPLLRAIRIDKLSLAALEGTLLDYLADGTGEIPVRSMLNRSAEELKEQANTLANMLQTLVSYGWKIEVVSLISQAGGGTLPDVKFPSFGVSLVANHLSAEKLEEKLRKNSTPIIVRIQAEKVLVDVRCLTGEDMVLIQRGCNCIAKGAMV